MKEIGMALVLMLASARLAVGQTLARADSVGIDSAVANYVARSLPSGVVVLDDSGAVGDRHPGRIAMLESLLGARARPARSVYACGDLPSTCHLDVVALVRLGPPRATAEGATLQVTILRRSSRARQPVARVSQELLLQKKDGSWQVTGIGRVSAS